MKTADRDFSSNELRARLYEFGEQARLVARAIQHSLDDEDFDEISMFAVQKLMARMSRQLLAIAGGATFDSFSRLEKAAAKDGGKAVAS